MSLSTAEEMFLFPRANKGFEFVLKKRIPLSLLFVDSGCMTKFSSGPVHRFFFTSSNDLHCLATKFKLFIDSAKYSGARK